MSIEHVEEYVATCDQTDCLYDSTLRVREEAPDVDSLTAAWEWLQGEGWMLDGGKMTCPDCIEGAALDLIDQTAGGES